MADINNKINECKKLLKALTIDEKTFNKLNYFVKTELHDYDESEDESGQYYAILEHCEDVVIPAYQEWYQENVLGDGIPTSEEEINSANTELRNYLSTL